MPYVESQYQSPWLYRQRDIHTILPSIVPRAHLSWQTRTQVPTSDKDELDCDFLHQNGTTLAVISHGLEGSSSSVYVRSLAKYCHQLGWDVCAWNFRGCSGRLNQTPYYYHSGLSEDLHCLINWIDTHYRYQSIVLVGFSIGGNITLKYLGEQGKALPSALAAAVCWSAPVHLSSSARELARPSRGIYQRYFIDSLKEKILKKAEQFPGLISLEGLNSMKTFHEFDRAYTAPMHGFKDEEEYWEKSSSGRFLENIQLPTLLVNALDDPFLAAESYPYRAADSNPLFFLETPGYGGHVAFMKRHFGFESWMNLRTVEFLSDYLFKDSLDLHTM